MQNLQNIIYNSSIVYTIYYITKQSTRISDMNDIKLNRIHEF